MELVWGRECDIRKFDKWHLDKERYQSLDFNGHKREISTRQQNDK